MKLTISRETLLKPLQFVSGVIEKRATLPILSNILLQLESKQFVVTGTDLEVELTAQVPHDNPETGEITLPARKLLDICRSLPEQEIIEISIEEHKAKIKSGKSRFTLSTLPASEFPSTENVVSTFSTVLPQQQLKQLLVQSQFCMANQDVRYYLNGLLLEIRNEHLVSVATDGHRLAYSELALPGLAAEERQAIIPRKGVIELIRLLDDSSESCEIAFSSHVIRVQMDDMVFVSKLIDGKFPDYQHVIPRPIEHPLETNREALYQCLQRTAILANEKFRGIRLQLSKGLLKTSVTNTEQEYAEEEFPVQYDGNEFEIGFNVSYLLEALSNIHDEDVVIHLVDGNSSCLIHGKENQASRYVVMPMRL